jgi:hypothetical protein
MAVQRTDAASWLRELVLVYAMCWTVSLGFVAGQTGQLNVDASPQNARKIPDKMFGIFFEEINHAGAGGLWAELVSNRGKAKHICVNQDDRSYRGACKMIGGTAVVGISYFCLMFVVLKFISRF